MKCRHCDNNLEHVFLDLGFAPPSNAYIENEKANFPEVYYPLKLFVCDKCWLVQTEDYTSADELFNSEYAYFSSVSSGWLEHAKTYVSMITERLELNKDSYVIEVASNDGYLLRNFVDLRIHCLGIEPTDSTARAAEKLGIPVLKEFFGAKLADRLVNEGKKADLILGNNVYAHVPDINDFTAGLKKALKPKGTITLEFPHLMQLIDNNQFDTVYHEHFSYFSLGTVVSIFEQAGLKLYDVEELETHGGSLRVYGCHSEDDREQQISVSEMLKVEEKFGLKDIDLYKSFHKKANKVKNDLLTFLIEKERNQEKVVAYGAAAKGNTLLNYAGVKPDLLPVVFDAAPSKQGKLLPGSHIPIVSPKDLPKYEPDYVVILPWNIASEVMKQNEKIREWGGKFVVAVPELKIM